MLNILSTWKAIIFYGFVSSFMMIVYFTMQAFEKALRTFEMDAELSDHKLR